MPDIIRPVDPSGPDLERYAELIHDGLKAEWGDRAQQRSLEDFRVEALDPHQDVRFYLLWINDLPVGTAEVVLHDPQREELAFVHVRTRKGYESYQIGQKLLRHAEQVARENGCVLVRGTSAARSVRDDRNTRFLKKSGYREVQRVLRQDLDFPNETFAALPTVESDRVEATVIPDVPDLSVCEALVRLATVPREAEGSAATGGASSATDANALQAQLRSYVTSGRFVQLTILRSRKNGDVVGCTEVQYRPGDAFAEQFDSFIEPAFRDEQADLLLRQASLRALQAAHPDVPGLRAFTGEDQAQTIAIKRTIGYRDIAWYRDWEKALT